MVDDRRARARAVRPASDRAMRLRCAPGSAHNLSGAPHILALSRQNRQLSRSGRISEEGHRATYARVSSSGSSQPGPRSCIVHPSHLGVSHVGPGLRDRPCRWCKSSAVSMQRGCGSCRAFRSDSSKWPNRIVEGFISVQRCVCTSARSSLQGRSRSCYSRKNLDWS